MPNRFAEHRDLVARLQRFTIPPYQYTGQCSPVCPFISREALVAVCVAGWHNEDRTRPKFLEPMPHRDRCPGPGEYATLDYDVAYTLLELYTAVKRIRTPRHEVTPILRQLATDIRLGRRKDTHERPKPNAAHDPATHLQ